jgi:hypothetical protein
MEDLEAITPNNEQQEQQQPAAQPATRPIQFNP